MLFITGGDRGPGLGFELFPLVLLELCRVRLRPLLLNRARWKLIKLAAACEYPPIHSVPGLGTLPTANGFATLPPILFACGVLSIISSLSPPMDSSSSPPPPSSSSLLLVSDSIMFTLDTELDTVVRSLGPDVENGCTADVDPIDPRRGGMATPRPPIVGDDSGDDSARVDKCKFVHAREKSSPRDLRGRTDPGELNLEPCVCDESRMGDSGVRFDDDDAAPLDIVGVKSSDRLWGFRDGR